MENEVGTLTVQEMALGERKFLHDIANHIVVAQGMASFVHKSMKDSKPIEAKDIERIEKVIDAVNKMTKLLKDRRALLHSVS